MNKQENNNFNKLINNIFEVDCLNKMQDIPGESIDMVLCDLPYGTTQNNWDSIIPLDKLWAEYKRIIKDRGVIVLTSTGTFTGKLIMSQPDMYKYKWVWEKSKATNFLNAKKQPLRKHEDVCIFYKKFPGYNPQMTEGEPYDKGVRKDQQTGSYGDFDPINVESSGARYPTDVLYFKTAESEGEVYHSTQKPVAMGRYFVKTYTNPGDVILDNTSGSGSFLVSALSEGRNFIGIEKNENSKRFKKEKIDYIKVSIERLFETWNKLSQEKRGFVEEVNLIKKFIAEQELNLYSVK
jgi:site-specific DNA-methyltransferase (adenine-specific)/modification methylase